MAVGRVCAKIHGQRQYLDVPHNGEATSDDSFSAAIDGADWKQLLQWGRLQATLTQSVCGIQLNTSVVELTALLPQDMMSPNSLPDDR